MYSIVLSSLNLVKRLYFDVALSEAFEIEFKHNDPKGKIFILP